MREAILLAVGRGFLTPHPDIKEGAMRSRRYKWGMKSGQINESVNFPIFPSPLVGEGQGEGER